MPREGILTGYDSFYRRNGTSFFLKLDFKTKLGRKLFLIFGGAFMSWHKDPQCFFTMSFLLVLVFAIPINFLKIIRNCTGSKEL